MTQNSGARAAAGERGEGCCGSRRRPLSRPTASFAFTSVRRVAASIFRGARGEFFDGPRGRNVEPNRAELADLLPCAEVAVITRRPATGPGTGDRTIDRKYSGFENFSRAASPRKSNVATRATSRARGHRSVVARLLRRKLCKGNFFSRRDGTATGGDRRQAAGGWRQAAGGWRLATGGKNHSGTRQVSSSARCC